MKTYIIAAVILLASQITHATDAAPASAAYQFDAMACSRIAQKWIDNPFTLTMGQLDELALCAKTLQSMKLREQQMNKELNAIDRLYKQKVAE
ncbi:MAG: hypothetical protein PSX71_03690 [bacterium]|nr:hypothetical protein [bacterium]